MIPTILNRTSTLAPTLTETPTELATQPLRFTTERLCLNRHVVAAVSEVLADKSSPDQCLATIFENAFAHHYQAELNQIISNIETQHGAGTVLINTAVVRLLAEEQIDLLQNSDGSVVLEKIVMVEPDRHRHRAINSTLRAILPTALCELIGAYDEELAFCEANAVEIIAILESTDPLAKGLVFAAASHQDKISFLNEIVKAQFNQDKPLNLVGADLSNLNLTNINLTHANLAFANLRNCCLSFARLDYARLEYANLNNANLSWANLFGVRLDHARLIGVNLCRADLNTAVLRQAFLFCANLEQARIPDPDALTAALINLSNISNLHCPTWGIDVLLGKTQAPIDVMVVPHLPESLTSSIDLPKGPITPVIDESEKLLLLNRGIIMKENRDGTVRLYPALTVTADPMRKISLESALKNTLPNALTDLISCYDGEIEISDRNENTIIEILKSGDQMAKEKILAAASSQMRIRYLNTILLKLRQQGIRLDLSHVDLSRLKLPDINLTNVNLSHAVMHGCRLRGATFLNALLVNADLNHASLEGVKFGGADMTGTNLSYSNLKNAMLIRSILTGAVLTFADLEEANLAGSDLTHACLDHAILKRTNLTQAVMIHVSLAHAELDSAFMDRANLTNAKMMHAKLTYTSLSGVNLTNADLSRAILKNVTLADNPVLTGTVWNEVRARGIHTDSSTRKLLPWRIRFHCY